jgi:hypothetical protein
MDEVEVSGIAISWLLINLLALVTPRRFMSHAMTSSKGLVKNTSMCDVQQTPPADPRVD